MPAFYTPGGHRRYRQRDLDAFLDRSRPAGAPAAEPGPLVVIVDDDSGLREYVRVNLERGGLHRARGRRARPRGSSVVDDRPPDLILLDVMMPEVDGWELLRRLRERHGIGTIPVIMFSGKVDGDTVSDAESHGAQGFIGKPFDPQQLIDSTKQLLPV